MDKVKARQLPSMIGQELGPSRWETITQAMIDHFGEGTTDRFWIHTDVPRATAAFGGTIAHGLLVLSVAPVLAGDLMAFADVDLNYGFDKVRFMSVVHAGDRVRVRVTPLGLEPRGEGALLRLRFTIEVEGREKPAIVAEWLFMLFDSPDALARRAGVGEHA